MHSKTDPGFTGQGCCEAADNNAQQIVVEVGEGSRDWVSVRGKLSEGDWVAVRGVERLQNGQQVSRTDS